MMRIIAKYHTADYRGDHAADVCQLHDVGAGETVQGLCQRLFKRKDAAYDYIELRLVAALPAEEAGIDGKTAAAIPEDL